MNTIPHPAVLIWCWLLLSLSAQRLQVVPLVLLCVVLFVMAFRLCAKQLICLLRRTRWIIITLTLIYAYTTPGDAVWAQLGLLSPTKEGLLDGGMQLVRLLSVLAGLAVLLAVVPLPQLIGGIYFLMYPLRWFGLSRERFAVRLALTLEYAESAMRDTASDWKSSFGEMLNPNLSAISPIEIPQQRFGALDVILVAIGITIMVGMWR